MLFIRSPHEVYYDIFKLVSLGFSGEYIENMSPAERRLHKSYNVMERNKKNNDENKKAAEMVGLDIEDL